MRFDKSTAGYLIAAGFVLVVLVLGVLFLVPAGNRVELVKLAAAPLGGLVAALAALIAAKAAHDSKTETQAQTPVIAQIQHQTNGVLSQRIGDAVNDALAARGLGSAPAPSDLPGFPAETGGQPG